MYYFEACHGVVGSVLAYMYVSRSNDCHMYQNVCDRLGEATHLSYKKQRVDALDIAFRLCERKNSHSTHDAQQVFPQASCDVTEEVSNFPSRDRS
jgi:hypothetical protein